MQLVDLVLVVGEGEVAGAVHFRGEEDDVDGGPRGRGGRRGRGSARRGPGRSRPCSTGAWTRSGPGRGRPWRGAGEVVVLRVAAAALYAVRRVAGTASAAPSPTFPTAPPVASRVRVAPVGLPRRRRLRRVLGRRPRRRFGGSGSGVTSATGSGAASGVGSSALRLGVGSSATASACRLRGGLSPRRRGRPRDVCSRAGGRFGSRLGLRGLSARLRLGLPVRRSSASAPCSSSAGLGVPARLSALRTLCLRPRSRRRGLRLGLGLRRRPRPPASGRDSGSRFRSLASPASAAGSGGLRSRGLRPAGRVVLGLSLGRRLGLRSAAFGLGPPPRSRGPSLQAPARLLLGLDLGAERGLLASVARRGRLVLGLRSGTSTSVGTDVVASKAAATSARPRGSAVGSARATGAEQLPAASGPGSAPRTGTAASPPAGDRPSGDRPSGDGSSGEEDAGVTSGSGAAAYDSARSGSGASGTPLA